MTKQYQKNIPVKLNGEEILLMLQVHRNILFRVRYGRALDGIGAEEIRTIRGTQKKLRQARRLLEQAGAFPEPAEAGE